MPAKNSASLVTDADDDLRVHDELLDADTATAGFFPQVRTVEFVTERFRSERLQELVIERVAAPVERAEAARITKSQ